MVVVEFVAVTSSSAFILLILVVLWIMTKSPFHIQVICCYIVDYHYDRYSYHYVV